MPIHPTDDDLVLHAYGENPADERAALEAHLERCESCRTAWSETMEVMRLADGTSAPDPGPDFERTMWARIEPHLAPPQSAGPSYARLATFAALAASVVAVVGIGYMTTLRFEPAPPAPSARQGLMAPDAGETRERVMLTAVDAHLSQAEMLFVELLNTPAQPDGESSMFEFTRDTAGDLVSSGRLYRETARQTGDVAVAAVLDDLETVLVEVARGGNGGAQDFTALRDRIEDDGLLFKVRAVSHDIRNRQSRTDAGEGAL